MERQQSSSEHPNAGGEINLAPHPERLEALTERFRVSSPEDRANYSLGALMAVVDGMVQACVAGDQERLMDWLRRGMAVVAALETVSGTEVNAQNSEQL
jgi:hypothetical protein